MFTLIDKTDTLAVVALAGRLDTETTRAAEEHLEGLLQAGHRFLVLEFSTVTLLASDGLKLLLRVEAQCQKNEGALVLAAVPEPVRVVLELAGFAPHFRSYPDVAAARAALEA